ncbi:unnamed protein product [Zymoseptoria tritici ST99CH_1A5]|uniref:CBM1 domain-containing protein n=3 Tax=Zymoseptoria tritici TaxID=1047171 RepID=A0A1X7RL56_ZYMT9|nr:unnamed protein product [Zymoseptoria tritici ST99CH_3D7]SMR46269.1 unnamed protein product [Zymoseptoria tritici ST99CH_1E4]SMR47519.1 unnamed protein product [Zymoseptoria tritici ST99CH_3D1]SMY21419.1 unnamed protein product [Zymoseptoria tritici ST99CH_1A5]
MQLSQLSLIFAITASSALANEKGKPFDTGICNHQDTSWANGYCYGSGDHQYDTPLKCNDYPNDCPEDNSICYLDQNNAGMANCGQARHPPQERE